jgi:hypothetical protein
MRHGLSIILPVTNTKRYVFNKNFSDTPFTQARPIQLQLIRSISYYNYNIIITFYFTSGMRRGDGLANIKLSVLLECS